MPRPVSIVTVTFDTFFFTRLLVEKVREFIGAREYEIIAVDRGSTDGTREWLDRQTDVRLLLAEPTPAHGHGEAAESGGLQATYEAIVLLDSDAHPVDGDWLTRTVDRLDAKTRLAGAEFGGKHRGNPYGWYIHPHFMGFLKDDLGSRIILRKMRGHDTDTGEEATIRLLDAGLNVLRYPLEYCSRFSVGHPHYPTVAGGVFHAWYGTRLQKEKRAVGKETQGVVTNESYLEPLLARLRSAYQLDY